uniref:Uncharacterized protein n=1 Tax=Haptolina brevifila TaxID=156173 RepID=A0A7S2NKC1_9EUKA|mmetsp:Transcript_81412/g.161928  ORF Transcript_81412/g.161928 Transcript_81412/m.161928 type:complete len:250 (+) Transcript_81412:194-943(+)
MMSSEYEGSLAPHDLWVNAASPHALGRKHELTEAPPGPSRYAWSANQLPSSWDNGGEWDHCTDLHPLPLRRGAPSNLWMLLHAFGLREYRRLNVFKKGDVALLASSILFTLLLVSQIGLTFLHWSDVLPLHLAIAFYLSILGSWLQMIFFLQTSHIHPLFASSALVILLLPPKPPRLALHPSTWLPSILRIPSALRHCCPPFCATPSTRTPRGTCEATTATSPVIANQHPSPNPDANSNANPNANPPPA